MDFQYYINILLRRKWAIILTSILAAILAFYLANALPPVYETEATLQTGVLNYDGGDSPGGFIQEFQINARFENLIQEFRSRKMLRLESFRLLVHDLDTDEATIPFRQPKEKIANVSPEAKQALIAALKDRIKLKETALDGDLNDTYTKLAKAYGYDYESLLKILEVARNKKTDYLKVKVTAKNPVMAAFLANNLCKDYIEMSSSNKHQEQNSLIENYAMLTKEKKHELDSITGLMRAYMARQAVANSDQQSQDLVTNLTDLTNKLDEAKKNKRFAESAILKVEEELRNLRRHKNSNNNNSVASKQALAKMKEELDQMRSQYYSGGSKSKDLWAAINAKQKQYELLMESSSGALMRGDGQDNSDREESLQNRKLDLEQQLIKAKEAIKQYQEAVDGLQRKIPTLVANDSYLNGLQAEKERLEEQYTDLANHLSNARATNTNQKLPLKIVEYAPIKQEARSNKAPYVAAFAGIGAGSMATMVIFLLAFFDSKLSNANQFKQLVRLPFMGTLPYVKKGLIPGRLFLEQDDSLKLFKESLRAIRYQMDDSNEDVFLFTSMKCGDGKSFVMTYLVEALAANGKKVLVIDTNFRNNSLSKLSPQGTMNYGIILRKLISEYQMDTIFTVREDQVASEQMSLYDLIGNTGRDGTPLEVFGGKDFGGFLEELVELYDVILMEGAALADYADTKELKQYADKIIGVFASNASLDAKDKDAIAYLKSIGEDYLGSILNGVDPKNLN